jgi:hypothetical protein
MGKMLLISQVAGLAKDIEGAADFPEHAIVWNDEALRALVFNDFDSDDESASRRSTGDAEKRNPLSSGGLKLQQLLDEWEEPDVDRQNDYVSDCCLASACLVFRV